MAHSLKHFFSLGFLSLACSAAALTAGIGAVNSPFATGTVVVSMPQTLPKPPPRPQPAPRPGPKTSVGAMRILA